MKNYLSQPPKIHFIEWNSEYERMMTSALKKEFNVHTIYHVKKHFKSVHSLLPGKRLKHWHRKFQIAIKFRRVRESDIIICNGYSAFLMLDLLSLPKCKKILVLRDSVAALTSKRRRLKLLSHDENYLDRVTAVFDVIYSFDPEDTDFLMLTSFCRSPAITWLRGNRNRQIRRHPAHAFMSAGLMIIGQNSLTT